MWTLESETPVLKIPAWPVKPQFSHLKNGDATHIPFGSKGWARMFEFSAHWHSASNIYNNINNKYYCIPLPQADLAYDFLKCLYFPPLLIWYVLCRMFFLSLPFDSPLSWKFVCHEDFF